MKKAIFCWSGGKDSALALYRILRGKEYQVKYLLTTLNENHKRISMHGVREELLEMQAASIGIPLLKMYVKEGSNAEYERNMETALLKAREEGINDVIFGDIFLEDLRKYREDNLTKISMKAVFPLWKQDTGKLISDFFSLGFKTIICCVNDSFLKEDNAGVELDKKFIGSLPGNVDPCGENGEFHTFCYAGPIFKKAVRFTVGEKIYKPLEVKVSDCNLPASPAKGFWFCELLPAK